MGFLFRWLAVFPLALWQGLGVVLGWGLYLSSRRYAERMRKNLAQAGWDSPAVRRAAIAEAGKNMTELLLAWFRPIPHIVSLVKQCRGWEEVAAARTHPGGLIFLTPHLGNFDIAVRYLSERIPLNTLYRPPRQRWLERFMQRGRHRGGMSMAPADLSGVRQLRKTLRAGGAVCVLPDQVPGVGDGVWAPFFGRPAYTMTLIGRLQQSTQARVFVFFAERLAIGRGFVVHIEELQGFSGDRTADAQLLNAAVERLVRRAPTQYLWSYNRYKCPPGAVP